MPMYDIVLNGGRVMDPESGTDRPANVGISDGVIGAITGEALEGRDSIDAKGLVVAPGAVDLHSHGQDDENYRIQALDGVTTALELELGVLNVDGWYGDRQGNALINFGASVGHIPVRMAVMNDPGEMAPAGAIVPGLGPWKARIALRFDSRAHLLPAVMTELYPPEASLQRRSRGAHEIPPCSARASPIPF